MRICYLALASLVATPINANQYECNFSVDDVPQLTKPCIIDTKVTDQETCTFTYSKDLDATCVGFLLKGKEILVCGWAVPGAFFEASRMNSETSIASIRSLERTNDIFAMGTIIDAPNTAVANDFFLSVDYNYFSGPKMLTASCQAP